MKKITRASFLSLAGGCLAFLGVGRAVGAVADDYDATASAIERSEFEDGLEVRPEPTIDIGWKWTEFVDDVLVKMYYRPGSNFSRWPESLQGIGGFEFIWRGDRYGNKIVGRTGLTYLRERARETIREVKAIK